MVRELKEPPGQMCIRDSNDSNEGTGDDDGGAESDAPVETDALEITYMGSENHQWTYTYEEALAEGFETIDYYNEKMLEEHNLICTVDEMCIRDSHSDISPHRPNQWTAPILTQR